MVGVDVVDIARLRTLLTDRPEMYGRLFTETELAFCSSKHDPIRHLAGTLAAKEAVIKAHRLGSLAGWCRRIVIERTSEGVPHVLLPGEGSLMAPEVSISHDGGVAVAVAFVGQPNVRDRDDELGPWLDKAV